MNIRNFIKQSLNKLIQLSLRAENPSFKSKTFENKFKILIYFTQLLSVLLTDKSGNDDENFILRMAKFITLQYINQVEHCILAIIAIIIIHLFIFIIVLILNQIKNQIIIEMVRIYFSIYDWILLIPCQMICFINEDIRITIFSFIVMVVCSLQFFLSIYFFRDSGFNQSNGRSKSIKFDLLYLVAFETIIILQFIKPEMHAALKYFLLYIIIIIKMVEFQQTSKFFEKSTQTFYYTTCIVVFIITVQCMLVELFDFQSDPYFYTLLLILPLLNIFQTLETRDIFDVEYFYYTIKQIDNPESQIQGQQLINGHRSQCFINDCYCRKLVTFNTQYLNKFVTQEIKREKKFNYLKYLSFQIQNNNNGFRNYLQIMKVMNRHITFTQYDKLIIKALLSHVREKTKQFYKEIIKSKFQEVIFSLQWFEENRGLIQSQLYQLISTKLNLWTSYVIDKIVSYQELYDLQISISHEIENVKQILVAFQNQIQLSLLANSISLDKNLFYQRICQIVELSSLSVNKYAQYEKRIQKITFNESGQGELLNYLMFENQQAMQLLIIISKLQRGKIEKISNQWNLLSHCENLGDLMPEQFIDVHNALIDNYCKIGPSKNQIFETFIKFGDTPIISRVKICINNFPRYDNDFLYLMGTLIKPSNQEEIDFILVDSNFQILGYSETLQQKIMHNLNYSDKFMKLNLFQIIPESKNKLIEYYEQMQKLNLPFHNHEKIICYKQQTKLFIGMDFESNQLDKKEYKLPLSPYERLDTISKISNDIPKSEFTFDIILTISEVCIFYTQHEEQQKFIYYWINFNFQDEKVFEKQVFQQYSFEIQKKKINDEGVKKIEFSHLKINESIAQTTSSLQQNSSHIFQFHQILTLINKITAYKLLLLISVVFFLFYLIAFILIYFQIQKKEIQQTQCFEQLGYSTEFLDKYGRIMIGSRHVIYRRDFNNFLNQHNLYHIDESTNINVASVDKISFSLYIYKQSILELIAFFEDQLDKLKIYYEQDQTVDLIRINYYANATEIQTIGSLAEYFQIMLQTFYMAIKTFAKDPTLYLKGTTDTYAQVNTRSILYFNFKRVSNITLNFMENCQQDDQVINALLDQNFHALLSIAYAIVGFQILLFIIVYKLIQKKRKFVLSLFTRTSLEEGVEEIQVLSKLSDIVKNSKIWFGIYEEFEENSKPMKQYFGKSIKSHIKSNLSSKVLWKFLIPLIIISYVSLIINHSYYIDYSSKLSPIVTAALKTLYIRLLFLNVINNWDVYVTREFYKAMISIQSTATGRYKLYTENIRHGYELYYLSGVDDDLLKINIETLQKEPYTELVYSQTSAINSQSLLGQDICIISGCDMQADVYSDRVYSDEMDSTYKVGIINLFKSTIQVINTNDFFSLTDPYDIITAFEKLEKSKEYFTYFLWGFDATLYQNRLFSNYFINLSEQYLEQLTSELKYLYFCFSFGSSFLIIIMLILGNWMIQQEFVQTIEILYQIPRQTIVNKQLGRQLRLL